MFGLGKRRCKECNGELAEMEALPDRADDLMKSSALGSAEPMANICAACRVKLAKGTQSLAMNLHVIEARRAEAEAKAPERNVARVVETAPSETSSTYERGEGFKTISQFPDLGESPTPLPEIKDFPTLMNWLTTTKEGFKALWIGLIMLVFVSLNMCSTDNSADPVDEPVATESPPSSVEPPLEEAEPPPEPPAAPVPTAPARPANNPGSWATTTDYPSRALNQMREGTTGFRLTINPQGAVTECTITQSSGHADLDKATCAVISRRARFERAPVGSPDRGYANRVSWRIPRE